MEARTMTLGGREKFLDLRQADILSWGALLIFLVSVGQLVSVGHFKIDLILSLFSIGLTDSTRGDLLWAWGSAAMLSAIIATGQYARATLAGMGIVYLIGGIGSTIYYSGDIDFKFNKLVGVEVDRNSSLTKLSSNKVADAIRSAGLVSCGAMAADQLAWCGKTGTGGVLNSKSSDLAYVRCETKILYKTACK